MNLDKTFQQFMREMDVEMSLHTKARGSELTRAMDRNLPPGSIEDYTLIVPVAVSVIATLLDRYFGCSPQLHRHPDFDLETFDYRNAVNRAVVACGKNTDGLVEDIFVYTIPEV